MSIEALDDIIESIMDRLGVYGAHDDSKMEGDNCYCRCCQSSSLRCRIEAAVEVDRKMRGLILVEASAHPPTCAGTPLETASVR